MTARSPDRSAASFSLDAREGLLSAMAVATAASTFLGYPPKLVRAGRRYIQSPIRALQLAVREWRYRCHHGVGRRPMSTPHPSPYVTELSHELVIALLRAHLTLPGCFLRVLMGHKLRPDDFPHVTDACTCNRKRTGAVRLRTNRPVSMRHRDTTQDLHCNFTDGCTFSLFSPFLTVHTGRFLVNDHHRPTLETAGRGREITLATKVIQTSDAYLWTRFALRCVLLVLAEI